MLIHPACVQWQVRKCGCDLSKPDGYMAPIKKATDDVEVALGTPNTCCYCVVHMLYDFRPSALQ